MLRRLVLTLFLIELIGLLNFSTALAENCSPVDLASEMGPIRNQGDIGWCYANAAADLLSYRYRKELNGQSVSALYTALLFNKAVYEKTGISRFSPKTIEESGSVALSLQLAMRNGFCPRTKDNQFMSFGEKTSLEKKLKIGLNLKRLYDQKKYSDLKSQIAILRSKNSIISEIPDHRLYKILEASTAENFLKNIADELCEGEKFFPSTESDVDLLALPSLSPVKWPLFAKINHELSRRRPVAITYFASFFESWASPLEQSDRHASVIVGRELRGEQCYYKIRNSWGSGCTGYRNPDLKGVNCDQGHLWVSEEKFKKYLYATISIQEE